MSSTRPCMQTLVRMSIPSVSPWRVLVVSKIFWLGQYKMCRWRSTFGESWSCRAYKSQDSDEEDDDDLEQRRSQGPQCLWFPTCLTSEICWSLMTFMRFSVEGRCSKFGEELCGGSTFVPMKQTTTTWIHMAHIPFLASFVFEEERARAARYGYGLSWDPRKVCPCLPVPNRSRSLLREPGWPTGLFCWMYWHNGNFFGFGKNFIF